LVTGKIITAYDSLSRYRSSVSNAVTVVASASLVAPTITGTYTENGTSVSGTLPASTPAGIVTLYEDGTSFGTVSIAVNTTSWTISGLSNTLTQALDNYLYAGSQLTAKYTPTGGTEGSVSNTVVVSCNLPLTNLTVNASKYKFCSSEFASVT